jgi:hypothetical protein
LATRAAAGDHSSDAVFRRNGPRMLRDATGHGFRMTFTFATKPQIACELLSAGLDVSEPWSICHDAGTPRNAIRSSSSQQRAVDGKRWLFAPRAPTVADLAEALPTARMTRQIAPTKRSSCQRRRAWLVARASRRPLRSVSNGLSGCEAVISRARTKRLRLRLGPITRRPFPFRSGMVQD